MSLCLLLSSISHCSRQTLFCIESPESKELYKHLYLQVGLPSGASGKEPACQCRRCKRRGIRSLGWEDPLEKGVVTHSSILVWRISWTEEPGRLQSMGSQRVGHDWVTNTFTFIFLRTIYIQTQHPAQHLMGFTNSLTPIHGPSWSSSTLGKECLMA